MLQCSKLLLLSVSWTICKNESKTSEMLMCTKIDKLSFLFFIYFCGIWEWEGQGKVLFSIFFSEESRKSQTMLS